MTEHGKDEKLSKLRSKRNQRPDEQLAKMVREHNAWRRAEHPYDEPGCPAPFSAKELGALLDEAASRLENTQRILNSKAPFNSEAFDV